MRSRRDPVNVSLVIRSRLEEFGLEQQDLAQAADGGARAVGGPRAQGAIEARAGGRARAVVSGSPRVDPPQVPTRRRTTRARRVREGALRRTGAPGHPEAAGRGQGTGPARIGERIVAPDASGTRRSKL